MKEFFNFLRNQSVIGLAVAFILGTAIVKLIETFVVGIVDPAVALIFDTSNLTQQTTRVGEGVDTVVFSWGAVVALLINLLIVALVVYFILRALGLVKPTSTVAKRSTSSTRRKSASKKK